MSVPFLPLLAVLLFAADGEQTQPPSKTDPTDLTAQLERAVADREAAQKRIDELNGQLRALGMGGVNTSRVWRVWMLDVDPPFKGSEKIYGILVEQGDSIAHCHEFFRGKLTTEMYVHQKFDGNYWEEQTPTDIWEVRGAFTDSMMGQLIDGERANKIATCIRSQFQGRRFPSNPSGTEYSFSFSFELH